MGNLCLGPSFTAEEIKQVLENCKLRFRYLLTTDELIETAVSQLTEQPDHRLDARPHGVRPARAGQPQHPGVAARSVFHGKPEHVHQASGTIPQVRRLGARRSWRREYFEVGPNARFLATVGRVRPEHRKTFESAILPRTWSASTRCREEDNPLYWKLLHAAGKSTGLPVLYNTSFNLFGDPLVCTPRDAVRSFYSSGIDALFVGNFSDPEVNLGTPGGRATGAASFRLALGPAFLQGAKQSDHFRQRAILLLRIGFHQPGLHVVVEGEQPLGHLFAFAWDRPTSRVPAGSPGPC